MRLSSVCQSNNVLIDDNMGNLDIACLCSIIVIACSIWFLFSFPFQMLLNFMRIFHQKFVHNIVTIANGNKCPKCSAHNLKMTTINQKPLADHCCAIVCYLYSCNSNLVFFLFYNETLSICVLI